MSPTITPLQRLLLREPRPNPTAAPLSNAARLYIASVCAVAVIVLFQPPGLPLTDVIGLATFLVLGSLAQLLPIRFYKNTSVSMAMAVALAAILVFGPVYAVWVNLASGIVHYLTMVRPKHRPFYRSAVTTSTLLMVAWGSGQVYLFVGGQIGPSSASYNSLPPLVLTGLCYYLMNTVLITAAMALEQRHSFWPLFRTNYQWLTVNIASLTPLGFGIAFIYQKIGLGGLILFLLPVVMAQYSFHLYARTVEDVRKANEELSEANEHIRKTNDEMHEANELVRKSNEELKDANERLNIMYEVSRSLVGSLHLDETLNCILAATKLMGFPAAFVTGPLGSSGGRIPHWRATHAAFAQWSLSEPDRATQTPVRKLVLTVAKQDWFLAGEEKVLNSKEYGLETAEYHLTPVDDDPFSILTLVPLFIRSEPWGLVGVGSSHRPTSIEMKELFIFRSMAENALEMALVHEQAERDAAIDARTGLYNHRYFQVALQRELQDAARRNSFLSFLMLDINNFKEFNDVYGHVVGDQVLEIVAQLMRDNVRESDIVCRYGGDELCVLLPRADRARAMEVASRIDRAIQSYPFRARREAGPRAGGAEQLSLRASIGIAAFPEAAQTRAGLVEQADRACYRAKALGGGVVAEVGRQEVNDNIVHLQLVK